MWLALTVAVWFPEVVGWLGGWRRVGGSDKRLLSLAVERVPCTTPGRCRGNVGEADENERAVTVAAWRERDTHTRNGMLRKRKREKRKRKRDRGRELFGWQSLWLGRERQRASEGSDALGCSCFLG